MTLEQAYNLAVEHHRAGRLREAEAVYPQLLAPHPDAEVLNALGSVLRRVGRVAEAIAVYRQALSLRPDFAPTYYNLGNALRDQGLLEEAIAAYREAARLRPDVADIQNNLGIALVEIGRTADAVAAFRQATRAKGDFVDGWFNLGNALSDLGQPDEAIAAFQEAISIKPDHAGAYANLGKVYKDTARLDEAMECYRRAISIDPRSGAWDNLLFATYLHSDYDAGRIYQGHARWNEEIAAPLAGSIRNYPNSRQPDRKLRIGYVSPDFRNHVVGLNVLPLFREHDRGQFEIFCYSNAPQADALTREFQAYAGGWREIRKLGDEQAAELIRQDRIDILVDLALHSAHNRLLIFARKPAAVQVTFAGYPGTTGLRTIDYRLTDLYLDPPGSSDAFYSEQSIRLPDSFWCYEAAEEPPVNPLPARANGFITFGCLNRFCKVNAPVLSLWAATMNAVAGSRLLMLCPPGSHRQRVLDEMAANGVASDRVESVDLQSREKYLRTYHRIDVGLDTFPYNGHTTSLDSFWMGVPVVTLVGETAVSRAGWSQLSNLGLTDLAANDREQFIEIASNLARDLPRLESFRSSLRQRMRRSPLMDAKRFTRGIEAAYRVIWKTWCGSPTPSPSGLRL